MKQQLITWGFVKSTLTVFPVSRAHDTYIIFATIILHSSLISRGPLKTTKRRPEAYILYKG